MYWLITIDNFYIMLNIIKQYCKNKSIIGKIHERHIRSRNSFPYCYWITFLIYSWLTTSHALNSPWFHGKNI